MTRIRHRLIDHQISPDTEILIIGTFNPDTEQNIADFFYGRQRNFLWTLIPAAFELPSLKGKTREEKVRFIDQYKIDFIDLIAEVEVDEVANYEDSYLDGRVKVWRDVVGEMGRLTKLKKVCLTRKSFGDIPRMKERVIMIQEYCKERKVPFTFLSTPARFYGQAKQEEWSAFFNNK